MINTILFPTDFAETAMNTGTYALELAKHVGAKKIVVYHTYNTATEAEPMIYAQVVVQPFRLESKARLNAFVGQLRSKAGDEILIEAYHSHEELTTAVNEIAHATNADLIVMGIAGGSKLKEIFVSSHSIAVAKQTDIPAIIVPACAAYKDIKRIALLSDLKEVETTVPFTKINQLLESTHAKLFVLHIHTSNEADESEIEKLNALLVATPKYHFMDETDLPEAVAAFVTANEIDMVITVPKKHGFLHNVFGVNHTKALAFHSKVPLVVTHK